MSLQAHPVAALFPLMDGADFAALVADVKANGLLQPIWLHKDGTILDGRNRYRACTEAGVEAQFKTWQGPEAGVVQFVTSMNLHRRHLSSEQRAFIAAELATMTRQTTKSDRLPDGQMMERPLVSRTEAASVMRVEPRALDRARAVVKHAPELKDKVVSGEMSLTAAAKQAAERRQKDEAREKSKEEGIERGRAAMKVRAAAERLQVIGSARRKLEAWMVAFGTSDHVRVAANHVRAALAVLEETERG